MMQAADKIDEMRASLKFIADIATEELQYVKVGTGAEVALRHINRRAREVGDALALLRQAVNT
jgi:hypothetical protein